MSAHILFCGPSTAGKTSLMNGLMHRTEGDYTFTVDRTWTTRPRRPNEGDEENIFVTPEEFEQQRPKLLFPFQTNPAYEYGIDIPAPLGSREARMRILMPVFAKKFQSLVPEPSLICAILPHQNNPKEVFLRRDPHIDPQDLQTRIDRFYTDSTEAVEAADICFQNSPGLDWAVSSLRNTILRRLSPQDVSW